MDPIRVFWLETTDAFHTELRQYSAADGCPGNAFGGRFHEARATLDAATFTEPPISYSASVDDDESWKSERITRAHKQWPRFCACGYEFQQADNWQVNYHQVYEVIHGPWDGDRYLLRDAPPGACWDAHWYRNGNTLDRDTGPDGLSVVVRLPTGFDWLIDSECKNCTQSQYVDENGSRRWTGRTHWCWPRTGHAHNGTLDVRKEHGNTCLAGDGSIEVPGWRGFLRDGYLIDA